MDTSLAAHKQAETARIQLEKLQAGDLTVRSTYLPLNMNHFRTLKAIDPRDIKVPTGDTARFVDVKQHEAEVEKLKRGLLN